MNGTMSGIDPWRKGAAQLLNKDVLDVTHEERQRFKRAYFDTLHLYLYQSDEKNLKGMKTLIDAFALCINRGLSLEESTEFVASLFDILEKNYG